MNDRNKELIKKMGSIIKDLTTDIPTDTSEEKTKTIAEKYGEVKRQLEKGDTPLSREYIELSHIAERGDKNVSSDEFAERIRNLRAALLCGNNPISKMFSEIERFIFSPPVTCKVEEEENTPAKKKINISFVYGNN